VFDVDIVSESGRACPAARFEFNLPVIVTVAVCHGVRVHIFRVGLLSVIRDEGVAVMTTPLAVLPHELPYVIV
jgi:hypothetical protein